MVLTLILLVLGREVSGAAVCGAAGVAKVSTGFGDAFATRFGGGGGGGMPGDVLPSDVFCLATVLD